MVSLGTGERWTLRTGGNPALAAGGAGSLFASTAPENRHGTATRRRDARGHVGFWVEPPPGFGLLAAALVTVVFFVLLFTGRADATAAEQPTWSTSTATWYGPGFYGNSTACGQRYSIHTRGVAVPERSFDRDRWMPCGTRLTICRRGRCVRVRVIDTGRFHHAFDLSARTSMDLCRCWRPYTMTVRWTPGWQG